MRSWLSGLYRHLDRMLVSRLPDAWQRRIVSCLLRAARLLFPSHTWASSIETLLIRRQLRRVPGHLRQLPEWARLDMDDLARQVDPLLQASQFLAQKPVSMVTPIHWTPAGHAYRRIARRIQAREFDMVILVPWLKHGGADLGALHHAHACQEAFGQRTLVIATEQGDSPWASRLPSGVQFLDMGSELGALSAGNREPELVLSRLLVQMAPKRIHVINSHLAWRTIAKHGLAIRQKSRIYASLYCDELDAEGRREGLAQRHLPDAARWLDAVISDNSVAWRGWVDTLGLAPGIFHVAHFPAPATSAASPATGIRNRLLWASRLDRQKRPDLLVEIVRSLPEFHWDIHGISPDAKSSAISALSRSGNVTLHGAYEDFAKIVRGDHRAFVYTSAWDGLPNVLLEAASSDLPIIAPDIGGIRDLVPTPLQLQPSNEAKAYANAVHALNDPAGREGYLLAQRSRLAHFTRDNFLSSLKSIPGYA